MLAGAQLTVLDLGDNAFGPDGVKGIEKLLKSSACYTLQELRLNNCGMGIGGGKVSQSEILLAVSLRVLVLAYLLIRHSRGCVTAVL